MTQALTAVSDAERLARAALTRLAEPGDLLVGRWVARHGAEATYAAIRAGQLPSELAEPSSSSASTSEASSGATGDPSVAERGVSSTGTQPRLRSALADYRARLDETDPEVDLRAATRCGARLVCPGDPEWPASMDGLTDVSLPTVTAGGPPIGLWVRGPLRLDEAVARAVAIVGSRAATDYGLAFAYRLAAELAGHGYTVASGAAYGIDGAAHRGCLAAEGPTVAVLARGIDGAYPAGHRDLIEQIAANGLVVSEHPPGVAAHRGRFLVRNRLIAALTDGTVVVEAALRSGARNTASWAHECGRQVMAVPGPVGSEMSAGPHQLIRDGAAVLVTGAEEVVEQVGRFGVDLAPAPVGETRPRDELPPRDRRVLDAVPVLRAQGVGRIASTAGVSAADVLAVLGHLLLAGYVEQEGAGWRLSERERSRRRHAG